MPHQNEQSEEPSGLKGCMILILGIAGIIFVIWKLPWVFNFIASVVEVRLLRDLIWTSIVLLLGLTLYYVRENMRLVYGIVEILVGIVSTWLAVNNIEDKPDITTWLALAGAIYLVVRGLDNWTIGRRETGSTFSLRLEKERPAKPKRFLSDSATQD